MSAVVLDRSVGIDNVCAWPNLTRLPNGTIIATIFNQPCHGKWEGDVECWASEDNGRSWRYRGTPAKHLTGTNRMNVAAGLARNGDLIVASSGWDNRPATREEAEANPRAFGDSKVLPPWICRSPDEGRSWNVSEDAIAEGDSPYIIPFGDIQSGPDGTLGMCAYGHVPARSSDSGGFAAAFFVRSADDGLTWQKPELIGEDQNETALLYLGGETWLTASRTASDRHLNQFRSTDNGRTWKLEQPVSLPGQIPAHLLRMDDGRLLLTYGVRCKGFYGVHSRLSDNDGQTWSAPFALVNYGDVDGGYPASVQNDDGSITSAYYCKEAPMHTRYHMGAVVWQLPEKR